MQNPDISVIVRTALDPRRRELIYRAIDSITTQCGVDAKPVLVVNGSRFDPTLLEALSARSDLLLTYIEKITLADALRLGREQVKSPFFGFLDDDDYLLPGTLERRLRRMHQLDDAPDVVLTQGTRHIGSNEVRIGSNVVAAAKGREDALRAVFDSNWHMPGGALYRTATISPHFFDGAPRFHEWTFLACRMALGCKIAALEEPGFVYNDTGESESKSLEYDLGAVDALERILALELPRSVRPIAERKLSAALHFASLRCLQAGRKKKAWQYHWRSLATRGGWRYLSYTRRLSTSWQKLASWAK